MGKLVEQGLYSILKNFSMYDLEHELALLEKTLPNAFRGREISDLGCGDGKTTLRLARILRPKKLVGYEVNKRLLELSKKRGLKTQKIDFEKKVPKGDLAILWGVIHHLKKPEIFLRKIRKNFKGLVIREPVSKLRVFEAGKRLGKNQVLRILKASGIGGRIIESERTKALIVFSGE
ncbi:MAG: class I SAM-dependent methyltransferase [archaeon]